MNSPTTKEGWERAIVLTPERTPDWFGLFLGVTEKNKRHRVVRATKQCRGDNFRLLLYPENSLDKKDSIVVLSSQVQVVEVIECGQKTTISG